MSVDDIIKLLEFVLKTTYFVFRDTIYQQRFGMAMGSPVSPIACNLFMENLEKKAIKNAPVEIRPRLWKRYVDDVLAIIPAGTEERLNSYLNSVDETNSIKFTHEKMDNGSIPFLDVNISTKLDSSIKTEVYRKKTHTNQYLNFKSHHPLSHKLSVVRTLMDRAEKVVSEEDSKREEDKKIASALKACNYPEWALRKVKTDMKRKEKDNTKKKKKQPTDKSRGQVTIPYVKGLSEKISAILKKHKIGTAFRPHTNIRKMLVHPKDKIKKDEKCGVIYKVDCSMCDNVYVGETGRKLKTRIEEHRKDFEKNSKEGVKTRGSMITTDRYEHASAITDHMLQNNHLPNWEETSILGNESNRINRQIKEAIHIRQNTTMNRDEGAYGLSHLYDEILRPQHQPARSRPLNPRRGGRGIQD